MSVITIFSGSYCQGDEVAAQIAQKLGYELLGDPFLEGASKKSGISLEKLLRAMHGPQSLLENIRRNVSDA